MRLIDGERLVKELMPQYKERLGTDIGHGMGMILGEICAAPTIDPASLRPKGEWKVYLGGKELMCTACQATFWDEGGNGGSNFCPNCGADMRGETNDS